MSLFFVINDIQTFANNLLNNKYLERIMATQQATQWKMNFNRDTNKQVQEVIQL